MTELEKYKRALELACLHYDDGTFCPFEGMFEEDCKLDDDGKAMCWLCQCEYFLKQAEENDNDR